jgi:hypothetical protein
MSVVLPTIRRFMLLPSVGQLATPTPLGSFETKPIYKLHGVTSLKTAVLIFTAVRTLNLICYNVSVIRKLLQPISTYNGKRNRHTGDPVEHTGLFFQKVAHSRCDVHSKYI